jgi:ribonuclease D
VYLQVENEQQLQDCLEILYKQKTISFDLEFDRDRHTYGFDLCLIQIGYEDSSYIVDPLSIADLRPLYDFFEDMAILKLVHCHGEDLRLLHSLGCYPQNVADTEVMAKLLNYEQTSLAKLLESKCGISLNKKQQQSNWHTRPLLPEQLTYAADDVLYLPQLYNMLLDEIKEKNLDAWVAEENNWLQTVRYTLEPKTNFLKPGDTKNLSPWHAYVMNEVFLLRDRIAERKNKPAYMIMPEDSVRGIAMGIPDYANPTAIRGLHPSLRHGNAADDFKVQIEAIFDTADDKKLSKKTQREWLSNEEYEKLMERKHVQYHLKDDFFAPIQKAMVAELGTYAARYILSNGWITKWLNAEVKWDDLQPAYKRDYIVKVLTRLGFSFDEVLQYEKTYH